ncbi:uncharacterized protein N7459_008469 [Penicillium hispanicum]|uniref:uncharacterized protein n=1 Tax=Penicillium hispanicum TaxID=1080232 RepID=UPI00253FB40D|nr:uncharacterized protein N7459_008469 [Penicillium hispanicum]KAJ5574042.1 hypothetical protein N7459_008469 [Penicillium hispanicum]
MQKTFHFIDGVQPDRKAQRSMRRHVMKGKNAGKKLHRPSRLAQRIPPHEFSAIDAGDPIDQKGPGTGQLVIPSNTLERGFREAILTTSLPILNINLHSHQIIDRSFHCNLSLMQACNEIYLSDGNSPAKALYHLSQTFTQIQKRLDSEDALSDSTIALIASLILQEQLRNQLPAAEMHARGLQRIIQLRGGLDQLEGNVALILKVCKADIMLAWQHGGPTMFFRDRMSEVRRTLASRGHHLDFSSVPPLVRDNELDSHLYSILSDLVGLCSLLNNNPHQPILDFLVFEEIFVSICYRLHRFRSLNDARTQHDSQTVCHLGLLMFTMVTFFQLNRTRIIDFRRASLCFKNFLSSELCTLENDATLWLMVLGGICHLGDDDMDWIAWKIRQLIQRRGMNSWEYVRSFLCKLPWIHAVHDQPGRELWNRVLHGHQ